jgi:hypothetical protein
LAFELGTQQTPRDGWVIPPGSDRPLTYAMDSLTIIEAAEDA